MKQCLETKHTFIIILFTLFSIIYKTPAFSQSQNSSWALGDSAGVDFSNISNPQIFKTSVVSRGSCVSVADTIGNLVFYAFTSTFSSDSSTVVMNSTNQTMQNSQSIIGSSLYNELVIVPNPNLVDSYYLFCGSVTDPIPKGFFYSKIDMTLNGGLGAVVQKNIRLNSFRNGDCVTAIKHGNGKDWWVFSKYSNFNGSSFNRFYIYLVTQDSVHAPIIQNMNDAFDIDFQKIIFNSDGTKFMQISTVGLMQQFDFDRCTGIISNPVIIFPELNQTIHGRNFWTGAYSADDSKFYAATQIFSVSINPTSRLFQFDLTAPNIAASIDTLWEIQYPAQCGALRLAPDNKVYFSTFYDFGFPGYPYPDTAYNQYNSNLSVINFPDSVGSACGFVPHGFNLGGYRAYAGLPNNPKYDLGPLVGSGCDTLSGISEAHSVPATNLYVYHDSRLDIAFVNANNLKGKTGILICYDIQGREIFKEPLQTTNGYYTKDLATHSFSTGIYMVQLITDKEKLSQKFVVD
ncbi:MAG: T9SS type A sorting domain-containing protein [Bacteroidetes bacterium]|nr:T9SS type A sorting domain-containing protein [Bacteroidota bacterium]